MKNSLHWDNNNLCFIEAGHQCVVQYAWLAKLVEQQTSVLRVVGWSPTSGTNTFFPSGTLNGNERCHTTPKHRDELKKLKQKQNSGTCYNSTEPEKYNLNGYRSSQV